MIVLLSIIAFFVLAIYLFGKETVRYAVLAVFAMGILFAVANALHDPAPTYTPSADRGRGAPWEAYE